MNILSPFLFYFAVCAGYYIFLAVLVLCPSIRSTDQVEPLLHLTSVSSWRRDCSSMDNRSKRTTGAKRGEYARQETRKKKEETRRSSFLHDKRRQKDVVHKEANAMMQAASCASQGGMVRWHLLASTSGVLGLALGPGSQMSGSMASQ